jgi:anti-anti-sigma factor
LDDQAVFWIETRSDDAASLIVLTGELDLAAVPLVEDELRRACTLAPSPIIIDISALMFCDLAGLRALESARTSGAILTGRPDRAVRRLLQATGHAPLSNRPTAAAAEAPTG